MHLNPLNIVNSVYYAAKRHKAKKICGDIDIFALVQATKRQNLGTSITFDTILRSTILLLKACHACVHGVERLRAAWVSNTNNSPLKESLFIKQHSPTKDSNWPLPATVAGGHQLEYVTCAPDAGRAQARLWDGLQKWCGVTLWPTPNSDWANQSPSVTTRPFHLPKSRGIHVQYRWPDPCMRDREPIELWLSKTATTRESNW